MSRKKRQNYLTKWPLQSIMNNVHIEGGPYEEISNFKRRAARDCESDFWRNVFHGSHFDTESGDFIGSVHDIYFRLRENLGSFREEFLKEMEVLSQTDQKRGRELEAFYLGHMKEGMLRILERDNRVAPEVWNETFTPERFVSFAFSNMVLLLKNQEDPAYFEEIMRRLIYKTDADTGKEV